MRETSMPPSRKSRAPPVSLQKGSASPFLTPKGIRGYSEGDAHASLQTEKGSSRLTPEGGKGAHRWGVHASLLKEQRGHSEGAPRYLCPLYAVASCAPWLPGGMPREWSERLAKGGSRRSRCTPGGHTGGVPEDPGGGTAL